jgi:hypothetical protein
MLHPCGRPGGAELALHSQHAQTAAALHPALVRRSHPPLCRARGCHDVRASMAARARAAPVRSRERAALVCACTHDNMWAACARALAPRACCVHEGALAVPSWLLLCCDQTQPLHVRTRGRARAHMSGLGFARRGAGVLRTRARAAGGGGALILARRAACLVLAPSGRRREAAVVMRTCTRARTHAAVCRLLAAAQARTHTRCCCSSRCARAAGLRAFRRRTRAGCGAEAHTRASTCIAKTTLFFQRSPGSCVQLPRCYALAGGATRCFAARCAMHAAFPLWTTRSSAVHASLPCTQRHRKCANANGRCHQRAGAVQRAASRAAQPDC